MSGKSFGLTSTRYLLSPPRVLSAAMLPSASTDIQNGIAQADAQLKQGNVPHANELTSARAEAATAVDADSPSLQARRSSKGSSGVRSAKKPDGFKP